MMTEEILETKAIYEGRVVNLDVHTVRLPNGDISKREVIRHDGAAAVVPIDDEGKVVMVRQYRIAAGKVLLELPAGGLDGPEEDPRDCAIREMQEEVGLKPGELVELGVYLVAAGYTSERIHLYLGRQLSHSRLEMDHDEYIEVVRLPFLEVLEMAYDGRLVDSKTIIGVVWAARYLEAEKGEWRASSGC